MNRVPIAAELKDEYEQSLGNAPNHYKSVQDYIEAGFERRWWNQGSIADKAELERLNGLPEPPRRTAVVVELDDVIRATAEGILEGLKLDGVAMEDLESRFLFQCKGFGTPTDVIRLLDSMPYTPVRALPHLMYGLHALRAIGYKVLTDTSRPDDQETKDWLETWLIEHGIYVGKGEVVSDILWLNRTDAVDNAHLLQSHKSKYPMDMSAPPKDCPLGDEEVPLVELMRKAEHESNATSLNRLVDIICRDESIEEVVYVNPSLLAQEASKPLLRDRKLDSDAHLVLFGDYAWNKIRLDCAQRGAWMTYEQRQRRGEKLGEPVPAVIEGVETVAGWEEFVKLVDPEAEEYLWRTKKAKVVAGGSDVNGGGEAEDVAEDVAKDMA